MYSSFLQKYDNTPFILGKILSKCSPRLVQPDRVAEVGFVVLRARVWHPQAHGAGGDVHGQGRGGRRQNGPDHQKGWRKIHHD